MQEKNPFIGKVLSGGLQWPLRLEIPAQTQQTITEVLHILVTFMIINHQDQF